MDALFIDNGRLTFRNDCPIPTLSRNEALIKLRLAGICTTDTELLKGYAKFTGIPGHEFVGEVVKVKDNKNKHLLGKRVVANINIGCGECEYCKIQVAEHCLRGRALGIRKKDGVFAEYASLPVENIYVLPKSITDKQAVFTEPLAAALRVVELLHVPVRKNAAIIGPGKLGILISQVLSFTGINIVVLGKSKKSLNLPKKLGLNVDLIDDVKDRSFDVVVEATGNEIGFSQALRIIKPMGKVVLKSTYNNDLNLFANKIVVDEISIIGSRCGPFAPAIKMLENDLIRTEELIEAVYPLRLGVKAFELASQPGAKKVMLNF